MSVARHDWSDNVTETVISVDIMKETEEGVDVTVLAERRAKLAKLRGEHFVHDRDITSAPSVTVVDEFEHKFGTANRQQREAANDISNHVVGHKIFYAEKNTGGRERKTSDLEFNTLVSEASRRGRKYSTTGTENFSQEDEYSVAGGDDRLEDKKEMFIKQTSSIDIEEEELVGNDSEFQSAENHRNKVSRAFTFTAHDYSNDKHTGEKRNILNKEKSTKIYQDGRYILSSEDLGY